MLRVKIPQKYPSATKILTFWTKIGQILPKTRDSFQLTIFHNTVKSYELMIDNFQAGRFWSRAVHSAPSSYVES